MDSHGLMLSLLAAAAMASLAGLALVQTDKLERGAKLSLDTADVDMVVLTAIITFVAMMVACHPEWVS
jgi:hypothetical protein